MKYNLTCPACKYYLEVYSDRPQTVKCPSCGKIIFLVADLFCGAGGTSTGAVRAVRKLGAEIILVCVNHWPLAIDTHKANHPEAMHYIEDITRVKPRELVPWGFLDLLMASPECTHFSRARGGKPVNNQSRMSPSAILEWLRDLNVKCLLVENVLEFMTWGPVDAEDQPIKEMKGIYFERWIKDIKRLGYKVDYTVLNAADYGDATTRKRFFLIARKDSHPVTFPPPTHSKTGGDGLKKWRAAKEIIDWNIPGRSIFDDEKYKKRPLSVNTKRRIAAGFKKQNSVLAPYFVRALGLDGGEGGTAWPVAFTLQNRKNANPRGPDEPIHTITANWHGGNDLIEPVIEPFLMANRSNSVPRLPDEPLHTVTAEKMGNLYKVEGEVKPFMLGQQSGSAARSTDEPPMTVAGAGAISLVQGDAQVLVYHGKSDTQPVDKPLPSLPTHAHAGLVQHQLVKYHGNDKEAVSIDNPLDTLTTKPRYGLVESVIVQTDQTGSNGDCVRSAGQPMHTLVTKLNAALAAPVMIEVNHGEDKHTARRIKDLEKPIPAATTKRGLGLATPAAVPAGLEDIDPARLVWIDGVLVVLDILFRMLSNDELARAHSFNSKERRYEFIGTKAEITKQIGNSVPCGVAMALVINILMVIYQEIMQVQEVAG